MRNLKALVLSGVLMVFAGAAYSQFAGGSGTEADPWQVATAEQLDNVRNYLGDIHSDKHFIQTSNIDLGVAPWNQGAGWVKIGYYDDWFYENHSFCGNYNGDGHVISNLFINRPNDSYQGLFGYSSGEISNLGLVNTSVTGHSYTGSLVGENHHGTITSCYNTGYVSGEGPNEDFPDDEWGSSVYIGGLVGHNYGTITNCYNTGNISSNWRYTGGLVGINRGTISHSHNSGNVSGFQCMAGLVGVNYNVITNCHNTGSTDSNWAGLVCDNYGNINTCYNAGIVINGSGLVENNEGGTITNCYNIGNASGGSGLVEWNGQDGIITNCYNAGNAGYGLVGYSEEGTTTNSYWDIQSSGASLSAAGEGRNTVEMAFPSADNTYLGWDWRIWKPDISYTINNGYPYFRDPDEQPSHAPEPATALNPTHQAQSVLPSVILNWNVKFTAENTDNPTGFRLYLGTDNPPSNLVNGDNLGYVLSYDPAVDLNLNTTYYWQVVPYNQAGETQNCPVLNFTTYNPSMSVNYPSGGELWMSGTTRTVRWPESSVPEIELYISFDNGSQWVLISTTEGSTGFYHYQVPPINSTQCLIKLENSQNSSEFAISNIFAISTSSSLPKVVLSYPSAGGIHFEVGTNVNISWTRQNVAQVALDWSSDNGKTWSVLASGTESASYLWTVPDAAGRAYRIRVRSDINAEILDISDNIFTISKVEVLTQYISELLTGDYSGVAKTPITWTAPGAANVKIDYSTNGGGSWTPVVSTVKADRAFYMWTIPGTPTIDGRIRISNVDNTAINDINDAPISIRNPITLINANGGGFITNNSMFNIRWLLQDIDPASSVYWEYSHNNTNWVRINANAVSVSDETMMWFVNTGLDDSVWLRAVESGTYRIVGKSENSFRVTDKILMLNEPNGGENYIALTTQTISWDHNGLSSIAISYTYDDGETWVPVADNIPVADLTYSWIVPNTPSINCRIKLQDETHGYMVLESDQDFTISPLQILDPTVDFEADSLTGDIPLSVQFTETVNPGVGNVASRLWDFGDGNTSDEENPLHVYTSPGTYTVSLSVINDFTGSSTETKEEYITALPNTPRIELLSSDSMNYGIVYLGDTSEPQVIEVRNYGTAPLHISEVSFYQANSQFSITGVTLPIEIAVEDTLEICVFFIPIANSAVSDSLYIISDASNAPVLAIKLMGVGQMVPPAATEEITIEIDGGDAHLSWLPVTTTIYGSPVTPDNYFVFCSADPFGQFTFLGATTTTQYIHQFVAAFQPRMFYHVIAYKYYGRRGFDPAADLKPGMQENEVLQILHRRR